jgi:hypothetical protein
MAKPYKQVHLSCAHEKGAVGDSKVEIPDHFPLTKKSIRNLLRHAQQTGDWRVRNSIQIRLEQGVKGFVCPRVIDGPVSEKESEVANLYLDHGYKPPTNILVNRLHRVMNF